MNSLAESQIINFFNKIKIKSRLKLSCTFNIQTEKIRLENNEEFVAKYYINKKDSFNSILSEGYSLSYLSNKLLKIFPSIKFFSNEVLITKFKKNNNIKKNNYQKILATEVLKLHRITNDKYGFEFDAQIGGLRQLNEFNYSWINFFREKRLGDIFNLITKTNIMPKEINCKIEKLLKNLENRIPSNPKPRLLHGDLWEGNILFNNGKLVGLIDPGIFFGHNEMEIAYLTWFKYIDKKFLDYYSDEIKITKNFYEYESIYQLFFSLLNIHLWDRDLYIKDAEKLLRKIKV
ncbi:fructosamine kinase family protein [Alphaproteobacteria bacterium]|nr:fructosamine kinase family protein [Alphaproteobacteria bacterium]